MQGGGASRQDPVGDGARLRPSGKVGAGARGERASWAGARLGAGGTQRGEQSALGGGGKRDGSGRGP